MYTKEPKSYIKTPTNEIPSFVSEKTSNMDQITVDSFGEEWSKFSDFSDSEIEEQAKHYFDIIPDDLLNKDMILADFGCGSGKFSKYMASRVGRVHSIDPSKAILVANRMLSNLDNVHLCQASISDLPFEDEFFDFGMAIGVLHHIPDTEQALQDCVAKIKIGGHFLAYIYYNFDTRGFLFKSLWKTSELIRAGVSKLPVKLKFVVSDILAILVYMPLILFVRILKFLHITERLWRKIALSTYVDKSFSIIKNDCLDRFGTPLENRFSKQQIKGMMINAGCNEITFSDHPGYWHVIGKKVK